MKMDSASADAGKLLQQESLIVAQPPDTTTLDSSLHQSLQKDVTLSSTSADTTSAHTTTDEDGDMAASVNEPTESAVFAGDNLVVSAAAMASPGSSLAAAPGKAENEATTRDSMDKINISEDKSGNDSTTTAPVIAKT